MWCCSRKEASRKVFGEHTLFYKSYIYNHSEKKHLGLEGKGGKCKTRKKRWWCEGRVILPTLKSASSAGKGHWKVYYKQTKKPKQNHINQTKSELNLRK